MPLLGGRSALDLPIWSLTVEIWNCYSWPVDASTGRELDLPVDLSLDLPIWALTVDIQNCHCCPLHASTRGDRSVSWSDTWSGNMTSISRNLKLPFFTNRCLYWEGVDLPVDLSLDLPIWALTVDIQNCHCCPLHASTRGDRSASHLPLWSGNMTSNSKNLRLPFLTNRCLYWG